MDLIVAIGTVLALGDVTGRIGPHPAHLGFVVGMVSLALAVLYVALRVSGQPAPRLRRRRSR
jgi:hypothetical protein